MATLTTKSNLLRDIALALLGKGVPDNVMRLMLAQFAHETAGFTSKVFFANNNVGGMKVPKVRQSPYIISAGTSAPASEGGTYAKYATPVDSALDVLHLYKYNKIDFSKVGTVDSFAEWLKQKSYYGDPMTVYKAGLRYWLPMVEESLMEIPPDILKTAQKKQLPLWLLALPAGVLIFAIVLTYNYFKNGKNKRLRY